MKTLMIVLLSLMSNSSFASSAVCKNALVKYWLSNQEKNNNMTAFLNQITKDPEKYSSTLYAELISEIKKNYSDIEEDSATAINEKIVSSCMDQY